MKVLPSDWDKNTQSCRVTPLQCQITQQNNQMLNNVIATLSAWFSQMVTYVCNRTIVLDKTEINKELKKVISKMNINKNKRENKKDYINLIIALRKQADKKNESTAKEYYHRISKIEQYLNANKLTNNLYEIDYKFMFNFKEYLNTSDLSYTRCKLILRTFKTLIKEIGNDPNYSYDYDPKIAGLEIEQNKEKRSLSDKQETQIVLNDIQITALETLNLSNEKEKQVRDLFLLQCYTASRFSDLPKLLDPSNLKVINGKEFVRYMDKKEGNRKSRLNYVNAPLFLYSNAKRLWNKLTSNPIIINLDNATYFNNILKKIAKKSGAFNTISTYINARGKEVTEPQYKRLKSHSGRHTFITKWSEILSPQEIIQFTGHSDIECIKNNYLHRTENVINSQLSLISNKLSDATNNKQNTINQSTTTTDYNGNNEILSEIKALRNELTSPKLNELKEFQELFSDEEKLDRIADLALFYDIENLQNDFQND